MFTHNQTVPKPMVRVVGIGNELDAQASNPSGVSRQFWYQWEIQSIIG
jgi:hypothetical protein